MKYILNSAVITQPGAYTYRLVSHEEARQWLESGGWTSFVGYPATAEYIARTFRIKVPLSREPITMNAGDEALIVRLRYRVAEPGQKGRLAPGNNDFEIGILSRV